ncbi:tannase/feruloyl esterase family alpha/beta hydrolase [Nguyenibacter vanlangensis]|uniref:Tannase/feruloyl esterase family alpha/beta hydrolase n=1 Tax=Nguyenibacter vanlangensis TaxID=1216886 RepID=A0ABZ3D8C2_9PROT
MIRFLSNAVIFLGLAGVSLVTGSTAGAATPSFAGMCLSFVGNHNANGNAYTVTKAYFGNRNAPIKVRPAQENASATASFDVSVNRPMCLLKVMVGPGADNGPNQPSTSRGIGLEVWVPAPDNWNARYLGVGEGGYAGIPSVQDTGELSALGISALRAGEDGFLTVDSDDGHSVGGGADGSFAFRPNGKLNWPLLEDWAYRNLHMMVLTARDISRSFYGREPKFSYWSGGSTGGREGLMLAQRYPRDYNGIISAYPAINWPSFVPSIMWPQVVMQRDLGHPISPGKLDLVTRRAIAACDTLVAGKHDGFISDLASCHYDPTSDTKLLCPEAAAHSDSCLTQKEAVAVNKIWYGPTIDGKPISPGSANGFEPSLRLGHLWYGYNRGAILFNSPLTYGVGPAGVTPFTIGAHWLAIAADDPALADKSLKNGSTLVRDGWKQLDYTGDRSFVSVFIRSLQQFGSMNGTDSVDLREFHKAGGKIIHWHGLADNQIPVGGSVNYYERVSDAFGGFDNIKSWYRFFLAPGLGHGRSGASGLHPPVPGGNANDGFGINYAILPILEKWTEAGVAPDVIDVSTLDGEVGDRFWCPYPAHLAAHGTKPTFTCSVGP